MVAWLISFPFLLHRAYLADLTCHGMRRCGRGDLFPRISICCYSNIRTFSFHMILMIYVVQQRLEHVEFTTVEYSAETLEWGRGLRQMCV